MDVLINAINGIQLGYPTTNLYGSVIEGVSQWEDEYLLDGITQGNLIIFTDGSDTQGSSTLEDAIEARGDKRLYTVGLGDEIDPVVLDSLANPDGNYLQVNNIAELEQEFIEIQGDMENYANSFYWMNYMTPKRGDVDHTLYLEVIENNNGGDDSYVEGVFNSASFFSVYSGLYVNTQPDPDDPYGIDSLVVVENGMFQLEAVTYLGGEAPQYTWESSNTNVLMIDVDEDNSAIAYAIAVGDTGETAVITVYDTANDLQKELDGEIVYQPPIPQGAVAYYNWETGNGNTLYDNWGTNHGTIEDDDTHWSNDYPTFGADGDGSPHSGDFDGSDDYVDTNYQRDFSSSGSISVWANANNFDNWDPVIMDYTGSDYTFGVIVNKHNDKIEGRIHTNVTGYVKIETNDLNTNQWYHLVITYDGNNFKMYLDGSLIGNESVTGNIISSSNTYYIGYLQTSTSYYFDGQIDEVKIFDRALSEQEIENLYNYGSVYGNLNLLITNFTASDTTGAAPFTVNFTDQSAGNPTSWQWDFGDGATDTTQHPTHTYQNAGVYTVSLTVSDGDSSDTLIKEDYITVTDTTTNDPPNWQTPDGYEQSMTVTCQVFIDEVAESDTSNLVGAFVGDECRGVNDYPFFDVGGGVYVGLVTVASNTIGEEINFKLYDASADTIMPIVETLSFQNDGYGSLDNPYALHVSSSITQTIPLIENWNWISFNVEDESDMSVNTVLASINPNGNTIKTNNTSAQYSESMGQWMPPIEIDVSKLYKIKMDMADTLEFTAMPVDPSETPIELIQNWNWISYFPQDAMNVNTALSSLPAGSGESIKTNNTSAQYSEAMGQWMPPITMYPNKGYKIKMDSSATLTYPESAPARSKGAISRRKVITRSAPDWYVPEGFEESMSIACYVTINGEIESDAENMVGAFVDDDVRGVSNDGFFDMGNGLFVAVVTVAGNVDEEVTFSFYDASSDQILSISEILPFQNDGYGTLDNPYEFSILNTGIDAPDVSVPKATALHANYPNPFNPTTTIKFDLATKSHVSLKVYDTMGRLIRTLSSETREPGYYSVQWHGLDDAGKPVQSGLYFYRLETDNYKSVKRMLLLK